MYLEYENFGAIRGFKFLRRTALTALLEEGRGESREEKKSS